MPRKAAESSVAGPSGSNVDADADDGPSQAANNAAAMAQQELLLNGIENFELPKSLVTRISKSAVGYMIGFKTIH